jgi:hypothetical protein
LQIKGQVVVVDPLEVEVVVIVDVPLGHPPIGPMIGFVTPTRQLTALKSPMDEQKSGKIASLPVMMS